MKMFGKKKVAADYKPTEAEAATDERVEMTTTEASPKVTAEVNGPETNSAEPSGGAATDNASKPKSKKEQKAMQKQNSVAEGRKKKTRTRRPGSCFKFYSS